MVVHTKVTNIWDLTIKDSFKSFKKTDYINIVANGKITNCNNLEMVNRIEKRITIWDSRAVVQLCLTL